MDICVRCGACADKCHFYLGSGDPKNMPVLRAELDSFGLPALLHPDRARSLARWRRAGAHRRRHQGVVLLLLSVHGVPPLLGVLPLRHRHRGDHDDGPRAAEPDRLQHQLGAGAGGQLLPGRQSPGYPAARASKTASSSRPTNSRRSPASTSMCPSIARARRFCSSCLRPIISARRTTTRCSAT